MEGHKFQDLPLDEKVAANAVEQSEPSKGRRKGSPLYNGCRGTFNAIWWQWHLFQFRPLRGQYEIKSENQQELVDFAMSLLFLNPLLETCN